MDENKRFSKYAHKKSKTMGLLSCFGLRTKSYNAKKYELNEDKKDKKKKKRVSTDSFGVADTNEHPQLIEETGGGIHPITANEVKHQKDSNENVCHLNDKQKNEINTNEDNSQTGCEDVKEDRNDDKSEENKENQISDSTQEVGHLKENIADNQIAVESDHKIHSTSDDNTSGLDSGNQSQSTDQNTVSMDTSEMSGGADTSACD